MYRFTSFKSYSIIFITFILAICHIDGICSETLSSQTWSNLIQDISVKADVYKSNDKIIEAFPLNEGFMLLSDNPKSLLITTTLKPTRSSINNRKISSHNTSSTTTTTCVTITMVKTTKKSSPIVGHLGRKLLNEPSYDTDIDSSSIKVPIKDDEDNEFDHFLKVDDQELSLQLFNSQVTADGSGETTEETTEETTQQTTTSTTTRGPVTTPTTRMLTTTSTGQPILSNRTTFILTMNCTTCNATLLDILAKFSEKFKYNYTVNYNLSGLQCDPNNPRINVTLEFITDDDVKVLNELFATLRDIIDETEDTDLYSEDVCSNGIVSVRDVSSCYLIDLCRLCGKDPVRGACVKANNVTTCECFVNKYNPSRPYGGEFCLETEPEPNKTASDLSRWIPVIVGVLAGLTGIFLAITCCLWAIAAWRRRHRGASYDLRVRRLWHLPRAQVPTEVTNENVQTYLNSTISTISSRDTDSDNGRSNTTDSTFFKELDKKMGENLRATITRPNPQSILASLPSDTLSSLSSYDPIDELDSIIDHEDIDTTFHDPLNELFEDNDLLEVRNPNLKLPRPNVDSKPTGLFSYFYKNS